MALADARKGVDMYRKMDIPVLGVVQNMAGFLCPSCSAVTHVFGCDGAAKLAEELGVQVTGTVQDREQ